MNRIQELEEQTLVDHIDGLTEEMASVIGENFGRPDYGAYELKAAGTLKALYDQSTAIAENRKQIEFAIRQTKDRLERLRVEHNELISLINPVRSRLGSLAAEKANLEMSVRAFDAASNIPTRGVGPIARRIIAQGMEAAANALRLNTVKQRIRRLKMEEHRLDQLLRSNSYNTRNENLYLQRQGGKEAMLNRQYRKINHKITKQMMGANRPMR